MQFTPAGWYPDPSGAAFMRYWDGAQWTEQLHPSPQTAPQSSSTPPSPGQRPRPTLNTMPTAPLPTLPMAGEPKRNKGKWIGGGVAALLLVGIIGSSLDKTDDTKTAADTSAATSASTAGPAVVTTTVTQHAAARRAAVRPHVAATPPVNPTPAQTTDVHDGSFTMPNELGQDLQDAQNHLQVLAANPVYISLSHDVLSDRMQFLDHDWKVCTQNIAPGTTVQIDDNIDFGVVKQDESCP